MYRDHTKVIQIGNKKIGGGNPILIQSMTNTKTEDVAGNRRADPCAWRMQAATLSAVQCRPWKRQRHLEEIKKQIHIPLVADIHFDYRLAIAAMENGADKIRINPGNIGSTERVKAVVDVAKETEYSHPCRGKQRFSGERTGGEISTVLQRKVWWKAHWIRCR